MLAAMPSMQLLPAAPLLFFACTRSLCADDARAARTDSEMLHTAATDAAVPPGAAATSNCRPLDMLLHSSAKTSVPATSFSSLLWLLAMTYASSASALIDG
jgi:hypothetical protein